MKKVADLKAFEDSYKTPIYFLIRDDYITGQFLAVAGYAIFTTKDFVAFESIAGSLVEDGNTDGDKDYSRFGKINGILTNPLNSSKVWVVDSSNHCIREIDRETEITSTFAGQCGISGLRDGKIINEALLLEPVALTVRPNRIDQELYFYENGNTRVKTIKMTGKELQVHTVNIWDRKINNMCFHPSGDELYLVLNQGVWKLTISGVVLPVLTVFFETRYGFSDGTFSEEIRVRKLTSMVFTINDKLALLTDLVNNVVRLFDFQRKELSSICIDRRGIIEKAGTTSSCSFITPKHLFPGKDGEIFIMSKNSIFSLKFTGTIKLLLTYYYLSENLIKSINFVKS